MVDYDKIPEELRWGRNWAVAGPDQYGKMKAPHVLSPRGLMHISPTQSFHWKDIETTIEAAATVEGAGIGYILSKQDAYTCIDLDIKNEFNEPDHTKHTPEEHIQRFYRIIHAFDSYTERSASGQGFHIWVRGKIGEGLKRDGVEVYSQERFIVCTGDVYLQRDIQPRQELLDILVAEIRQGMPDDQKKFALVEVEATEPDEVIWERAKEADNSDKFVQLCSGNWTTDYPSQSEADLALMSIFAFYSKSNEQCRRMFRLTKLGERAKATKNDVALNRILSVIRGRQASEEEVDVYAAATSAALVAKLNAPMPAQQVQPAYNAPPGASNVPLYAVPRTPIPFPEELTTPAPYADEGGDDSMGTDDEENTPRPSSLEWPPGMVGALAEYIYSTAPRPVREVAIVSALGLMAGICGKAFSIPQSGLNLYIVLVARSAVGKEAMHSGIANVMTHVNSSIPKAIEFIDFSDYASGPALSKAVAANPSFVNVSGEWGRKLKRLAVEDGRDGPMQSLRTVMTNLYQKSGPASIVGGIGYSNKENNVASVSGAAYSMIGESTPGGFYEALTENMMEDGFLSRFTVIEYAGDRPSANPNPQKHPDKYLLEALCGLTAQAIQLNGRFANQEVERSSAAHAMLAAFDRECDEQINKTDDEGWRQMWNRAHLKALRIAALLAVGDNYVAPVIQPYHVQWALDLIRADIAIMRRRISSGDVGTGDSAREKKMLSVLTKYLKSPIPESYQVTDQMRRDGIVPRKYLQISLQRTTSFSGHRQGANSALDLTIKSLIDSGYLLEYAKDKCVTNYNFHGRSFRIVHLPLSTSEEKELKSARKN